MQWCGGWTRIVEGGVDAAAVEEAVVPGVGVDVSPDDLARGVDAECKGAASAQGIVEGGVGAAVRVVEEAVAAVAVLVIPDDLARGVDAVCNGAPGGQGIVNGGVGATAKEEAIEAAGVRVNPDDLARVVDAVRSCAAGLRGGRGIVEGGVGVDWHDTGSSMICAKASKYSAAVMRVVASSVTAAPLRR